MWRLIANMARNFASLADVDALRTVLATYNFRAPLLYATVFTAALLAVALFSIVSFAESRLIRWKTPDVH